MIKFNLNGNISDKLCGCAEVASLVDVEFCTEGEKLNVVSGCNTLEIYKKDGEYFICHSDRAEFFRGLSLLCHAVKNGKEINIKEQRKFKTVGSMLDVSRGFVFKPSVVKDLIKRAALMGMNMFMLYTEDTYEMENHPWFGYMRGAYTVEELKDIDDYADMLGIELIPCIQTLGHLRTALRWNAMSKYKDVDSVLLVGEPETYALIDDMFKTMRKAFRSNRIHIGMDETFGIGTGRYKALHGERKTSEIITEHLCEVCRIAEKYGYEPMMWSDMMFRLSGCTGEYDTRAVIPPEVSEKLPKNIEMVYWDYCMENEQITDTVLKMHENIGRRVNFAGGIWTWERLGVCYKKSFDTARNQLSACEKNGVSTVFATTWANSYSRHSLYSILPSLQTWMELCYDTNADETKISERFSVCTGYDFHDWKWLFADDFTDEELKKYKYPSPAHVCVNPSIQHFYNDVLIGLLDKTLSSYDFKSHYKKLSDGIESITAGDMQDVFERTKLLYKILYIKCDMGLRLRKAYKENNISALKKISEELTVLTELYGKYHTENEKMWFKLCKPFGYNSLDMELGSIESRIATAKHRIDAYLSGECDALEELDAEVFYYNDIKDPLFETFQTKAFMSAFYY